jgi:hypothetical protein
VYAEATRGFHDLTQHLVYLTEFELVVVEGLEICDCPKSHGGLSLLEGRMCPLSIAAHPPSGYFV